MRFPIFFLFSPKKSSLVFSKRCDIAEYQSYLQYHCSGDMSTDRRQSVAAFSSLTGTVSAGTMKYSDMTGTVSSKKLMGTVFSKIQKKEKERGQDIFTVKDGYGTQRSLNGLQSSHQADIVFIDKKHDGTEDRDNEEDNKDQYLAEPSSIFNR